MSGTAFRDLLGVLEELERELSSPSQDRVREILAERARIAAAPRIDPPEPDLRVLVLQLGSALYGVPLQHVAAVTAVPSLTALPGVDPSVAGLIQVRGRHVTAYRTDLLLPDEADRGRPRAAVVDLPKAVIVSHDERWIALLAQEVSEIRELQSSEMRPLEGVSGATAIRMLGPRDLQIVDVPTLWTDRRIRGG